MDRAMAMRTFETSLQRSSEARQEEQRFYREVSKNYEQMATTLQQMKLDYLREIGQLRDQLRARKNDPNTQPDDVTFFAPGAFRVPSWQSIVEELDERRKQRDVEAYKNGTMKFVPRYIPVEMFCRNCKGKLSAGDSKEILKEEDPDLELEQGTKQCDASVQTEDDKEKSLRVSRWAQTELGEGDIDGRPAPSGGCGQGVGSEAPKKSTFSQTEPRAGTVEQGLQTEAELQPCAHRECSLHNGDELNLQSDVFMTASIDEQKSEGKVFWHKELLNESLHELSKELEGGQSFLEATPDGDPSGPAVPEVSVLSGRLSSRSTCSSELVEPLHGHGSFGRGVCSHAMDVEDQKHLASRMLERRLAAFQAHLLRVSLAKMHSHAVASALVSWAREPLVVKCNHSHPTSRPCAGVCLPPVHNSSLAGRADLTARSGSPRLSLRNRSCNAWVSPGSIPCPSRSPSPSLSACSKASSPSREEQSISLVTQHMPPELPPPLACTEDSCPLKPLQSPPVRPPRRHFVALGPDRGKKVQERATSDTCGSTWATEAPQGSVTIASLSAEDASPYSPRSSEALPKISSRATRRLQSLGSSHVYPSLLVNQQAKKSPQAK
eukprot:TRINITY_DN11670_c0_g1_i1.p1 TRINITY_DN11670_c0_g1~~TRINITY_DN11670_c0_g1_i1.p1  ORF type:complete len:710 (+),score=144.50 TRINITY_DN11670_c0_g1_i1:310-2130(+)